MHAIAASDSSLVDDLCTALKLKYLIKESESLEDFLGVHMEQVDGRLHLSQPGLLDQEAYHHFGASSYPAICTIIFNRQISDPTLVLRFLPCVSATYR